jgi:hypothetical protein
LIKDRLELNTAGPQVVSTNCEIIAIATRLTRNQAKIHKRATSESFLCNPVLSACANPYVSYHH